MGIETEFILLKGTDPIEPLDYHDYSIASSLYTGTLASEVLEEIATALRLGGIEVQVYHAEAAPGQFEIVTAPLQPLEAADALVFTRETIANIANKHKLRSTLAPRVFNTSCMFLTFHYFCFNFLCGPTLQVEVQPTLTFQSILPMKDQTLLWHPPSNLTKLPSCSRFSRTFLLSVH